MAAREDTAMYDSILLAVALQRWDRYSVHAVAARDLVIALAPRARHVHVLSVYEHGTTRLPTSGLAADMVAKLREQEVDQTDRLMREKMEEYVAPLVARSLPVSRLLRLGSPRHVIVDVASEVEANLIVIGSHSKRGLFDIALGDTARHVSTHAPCPVVMVAPRK
jgi:nucleotide-binding universal stress UspA family protein